jgi:hypothetical protein
MNVERLDAAVEVGPVAVADKRVGTVAARNGFLGRYFYFVMSLVFALVVVSGFSKTVDQNLIHAAVPRPAILWVHGGAFTLWVVFYILQSGLVRIRKVSSHRLLGWFGAALATVMVVVGVATAVVMTRFDTFTLHQPGGASFVSVPFFDMIVFGTLVGLAIAWRKKPELHRRLLFIATCGLMDAPLGRYAYMFDHSLFYPCLDLLMLLGVARDLWVDGRVSKVYAYALPVLMVGQGIAVYLFRANPAWWQAFGRVVLG